MSISRIASATIVSSLLTLSCPLMAQTSSDLANGILRLSDVGFATLFFSDRPDRITCHEPTEDFVDQ